MVNNPSAMLETHDMQVQSFGQEDPLEKEMATHSIFLPGKFYGERSLVAIVHGIAESNMTEHTQYNFQSAFYSFMFQLYQKDVFVYSMSCCLHTHLLLNIAFLKINPKIYNCIQC